MYFTSHCIIAITSSYNICYIRPMVPYHVITCSTLCYTVFTRFIGYRNIPPSLMFAVRWPCYLCNVILPKFVKLGLYCSIISNNMFENMAYIDLSFEPSSFPKYVKKRLNSRVDVKYNYRCLVEGMVW